MQGRRVWQTCRAYTVRSRLLQQQPPSRDAGARSAQPRRLRVSIRSSWHSYIFQRSQKSTETQSKTFGQDASSYRVVRGPHGPLLPCLAASSSCLVPAPLLQRITDKAGAQASK